MVVNNKTYYIITDTEPCQFGVWEAGIDLNN